MQETQETWVRSLGQEDLLENGMATHSSTLAWRIPGTEEPGWLQSIESQRVRQDWSDWVCVYTHTYTHTRIFIPNWSSLMMRVDLCSFVSPVFDWLYNHTLPIVGTTGPKLQMLTCLPEGISTWTSHNLLQFITCNNEFKWPPQLK